jgi:hypothetical protein
MDKLALINLSKFKRQVKEIYICIEIGLAGIAIHHWQKKFNTRGREVTIHDVSFEVPEKNFRR